MLLPPSAVADSLELLSTLTARMIFGYTRARMAGATDLDAPIDYVWPVVSTRGWPLNRWYVASGRPSGTTG